MEKYFYSLLFQKLNSDEENNDVEFISNLNKLLWREIESEIEDYNKRRIDAVQKTMSGLRSGLSTYLTTPLMSDKNDIERVLEENVKIVVSQLSVEKNITASQLSSYKILDQPQIPLHRQLVGVMRRLIRNGKTMLADAGISSGKNSGNAYLTVFTLDEFSNLPRLKQRVDEVTKKHNLQFVIRNDSIFNILVTLEQDSKYQGHAVLVNYNGNDFIADRLNDKLSKLLDQFGVKNIRLAKKTFYAGFGTTFQLHIGIDLNKHALGTIIMTLIDDDTELEDALTTEGSIIVLEKIA